MNRKDYRKMMEQKKRNKMYVKASILGALGLTFFGLTTQASAEEWKANSVEQIKESIRQAKDGIYIVKSGDTLSGISEATGITIDTLAKVNNIENVDLIYAGDKLIIKTETGKIALVDENNRVKNEVPLTKEDKKGIKEVQKQDTNNVYSNNSSSVNSVATNNTTTDDNSNVVVKPVLPVTPKPDEKPELPKPDKPIEEGNGSETEKPEIAEFDKNVIYQVEGEGTVFSYSTKVKVEGTVKDDSGKFDIEYGFIDTTEKLPAGYKIVNAERDSYVKVFNTTANIVIYVEKIEDEIPVEPEVKEFDKNVIYQDEEGTIYSYFTKVKVEGTVKSDEGYDVEYGFIDTTKELPEGYKLVDEKESNVKVFNTTMNIVIKVEKIKDETPVEPEKPYVPQHQDKYVTVNVDTDGNILQSTEGYEKVSESIDAGVTTTEANGDTVTTYTTTVVWKKVVVTPPTIEKPIFIVSGEQFGGRKTSSAEVEGGASQLTSNGYTFETQSGANDYGWANMNYYEDNQYAQHGFFTSSIKMMDGTTRYVVEWNYILDEWE